MTTLVAGTRRAHLRHSRTWGPLGLLLSMAPPVALIVAGVVADGWGAISWLGAIVWGVVAAVAFMLVAMGRTIGMTRMDLLDLLGSLVAAPWTVASRGLGALVYLEDGAVLAVAWAYGTALGGLSANVWTALAWGGACRDRQGAGRRAGQDPRRGLGRRRPLPTGGTRVGWTGQA